MKHRVALGGGIALAAIAAAFWLLLPDSGPAQVRAGRSAKIEVRSVEPPRAQPAAAEKPRMVMTESGWRPVAQRKTPRTWVDPVNGAVNREIVDAVPDPESDAAEELTYQKRRLPLTLSDAAAPCWTGNDSKEDIEFDYTMIVENRVIRVDDVRIVRSNITNPAVERCIINAVRDLRAHTEKVPDMREEGGLTMSLHELYDRNDRQTRSKVNRSAP